MKVLWKTIKHRPLAWSHIEASIAGDRDICKCKICGVGVEMEQKARKRSSVFLEMARVHFYKHKLWLTTDFALPNTDLVEPQLFAGEYYD